MKTLKSVFAFLLVVSFFYSCKQQDSVTPNASGDDELISSIQSAVDKQTVSTEALPTSSQSEVSHDCSQSESYVATAQLAPDLGYQVTMRRSRGADAGEESEAYFDLNGRRLEAGSGTTDKMGKKGKKGRKKPRGKDCFELVYPVSFTMPDGSNITVADKEGWSAVKAWHEANPDVKERGAIQFPVDIAFEDGTTQTISNQDEMSAAKATCGGGITKCFEFSFPVNVTMPDNSTITLSSKGDRSLIKAWHEANPDVEGRGTLVFPVSITYTDGTTATINNEEEMRAAKQSCK
ncbi:hypothetical protein [Microscilla marina]|uniref:Lipoprotein, putative n=1 Tax=Microscilla marina ATCC 23134 TaxID=313606 RepID=A1ZFC5_MICM2|nr:hypothetical protein [Microscilla marina]EAY30699.1 lipoprotein, putative [Microscilla marina ATCC 23134]